MTLLNLSIVLFSMEIFVGCIIPILVLTTKSFGLDFTIPKNFNNFLTVAYFAEYYNMTINQAETIINIGRTRNHKR